VAFFSGGLFGRSYAYTHFNLYLREGQGELKLTFYADNSYEGQEVKDNHRLVPLSGSPKR